MLLKVPTHNSSISRHFTLGLLETVARKNVPLIDRALAISSREKQGLKSTLKHRLLLVGVLLETFTAADVANLCHTWIALLTSCTGGSTTIRPQHISCSPGET